MARRVQALVKEFHGLSDRSVPVHLTRMQSPDLLNIDLSERTLKRRGGARRLHSNVLRDASVRLDGSNDFLRIPNHASLNPSARLFLSIDCILRGRPAAVAYLLSRGSGAVGLRFCFIAYDPTINGNLGGWRFSAYDTTAAALQTVTVNDGDGVSTPINQYRHIEVFYSGPGNVYTFRVQDEAGNVVGTAGAITVQTWVASTDDLIVGATDDGSGNLVSNLSVTVAELRVGDDANSPAASGIVGRELDRGPDSTETDGLIGYWRLQDGRGTTFENALGGNLGAAIAESEAPQWISDPSLVTGSAGLEFFGKGVIHWRAVNMAGYMFTNVLTGNYDFALEIIFVPRMDQGETTVRDQVLFWSGTDTVNPSPIGITIESDNLKCYWRDFSNVTQSATIAVGLSTLRDTRCIAHVYGNNSRIDMLLWSETWRAFGFPTLEAAIAANLSLPQAPRQFGAANMTIVAGAPANVSNDWSFGQKVTSFNPLTVSGTGARCIISTVRLWKHRVQVAYFSELLAAHPNYPGIVSHGQIQMNDGYGSNLQVTGSRVSTVGGNSTAYFAPDDGDGLAYDIGIVDPYQPPETSYIATFRRRSIESRSQDVCILVISGCTLYEINPRLGLATPVGGNLPKPFTGQWSGFQRDDRVYMACANGKRPKYWDGSAVHNVGIDAPTTTPIVATVNAAGTFPNGTNYIYVTFRNSNTGAESNPGPSAAVVFGGANDTIDSVTLPISSDPQVNQRRIWLSLTNEIDGGRAYLVATIDENTSTSYLTDILTVSAASTPLEYFRNAPPPAASVIAQFRDRLFVGGNSEFPTRVWFSTAGRLDSFWRNNDYLDATLDEGDPVTCLLELGNYLIAYLQDGDQAIVPSGNTLFPFTLQRIQTKHGAVSARSVVSVGNGHMIVAERDIYLFDGATSRNISSPEGSAEAPSIEYTTRQQWPSVRKNHVSVAHHRSRSQVWVCYSSDGVKNNRVLVYDTSQSIWSKLEMDLDWVAESEDEDDANWIFGASEGFVCRLDDGMFDGHSDAAALVGGSVTGGGASWLDDTGKAWEIDRYRGVRVWWFDASTKAVRSAVVRKNSATRLYFYDTVVPPDVGDVYVLGGIRSYADFVIDFGNPGTVKRIVFMRLTGESDSDSNILRVTVYDSANTRGVPATFYDTESAWLTGESKVVLFATGCGDAIRMRIGDTGFLGSLSSDPIPSLGGAINVHSVEVEAFILSQK